VKADHVDFLLRAAIRLPRQEIERLAEGLIAALDALDGDPDLEDDDPGGDLFDNGEGEDLYETRPLYDVDQSMGPINERPAHRAHMQKLLHRA
jgi:hypothetical protein